MASYCRISQQLRGFELLGLKSKPRIRSLTNSVSSSHHLHRVYVSRGRASSLHSSCCVEAKSQGETPVLGECFSQREDDRERSSDGSVSVTGGIVALGKFDALHLGHRELAFQASKAGAPFLLSFVGMAEVLGWEPRAPVVAKCDRKRVLSSWTPYCGDLTPGELHVEFSSVRQLSPRQFVEKLSTELGVRGVVTGENYRFGYKAAGDTKQLIELCEEYGMGAYIVSSVMDKNQLIENRGPTNTKENGQVSSTRVRHALAEGDMKYVSELLGRKHRLMLSRQGEIKSEGNKLSAPKSSLLNLSPKEGLYGNCSVLVDNTVLLHSCKVMIDATHIYVESDNDAASIHDLFIQDWEQIGIEFGDT